MSSTNCWTGSKTDKFQIVKKSLKLPPSLHKAEISIVLYNELVKRSSVRTIMKYFFWLLTFLVFTVGLTAQELDSTRILMDTIVSEAPEVREGFFKKDYPDPKKAGLLSIVVPGAGQVYNKSWWKLPLVYGALGGMGYAIYWNTKNYRRFQDAYQAELKGEEHEFSDTQLNATSLKNIRDGYDKNRQLSYIGFVVVYLLNGVEAFVDAHLKNFDISDDLSLRVQPEIGIDPTSQQPVLGFGVQIPLQKRHAADVR